MEIQIFQIFQLKKHTMEMSIPLAQGHVMMKVKELEKHCVIFIKLILKLKLKLLDPLMYLDQG